MDAGTYPGNELSLSQLVFALNNKLKRVAYSPSYSLDTISQLDRDTSGALATIREWRNCFVDINRIPLDVLSLIPTHLTSQKDIFCAASVCRHWRRTFLEYSPLWSRLFPRHGEVYVKTLLERVKGSALDITIDEDVPIDRTITLLSPHTRQIKYLSLTRSSWADVIKFSAIGSGSLPLLRTLEIDHREPVDEQGNASDMITPSSSPIFHNAANVEGLRFTSRRFELLSSFVFPNLTTFELWMCPASGSNVSNLFDLLNASPMLATVKMWITGIIELGDIPQEPVVVLPNVETFLLLANDGGSVYGATLHISCPRSRNTSLWYNMTDSSGVPERIFPAVATSDLIARQYASSPVKIVTLDVGHIDGSVVGCILTLWTSDTSKIRFGFRISSPDFEDLCHVALLQAFRTIRTQYLLSHIKFLHIRYTAPISDLKEIGHVVKEVGEFFGSMGPLDKLTIENCDLHVYLAPFLDLDPEELGYTVEPAKFPPIKKLEILHPVMEFDEEEAMDAIVEFAKSQHAKEMPFEQVTVLGYMVPATMGERLMQWVGAAVCCRD